MVTRARYFSQDSLINRVQPYDTTSEVYQTYTATTSTNFLLRSLGSQSPRAGRRRDQSRTDRNRAFMTGSTRFRGPDRSNTAYCPTFRSMYSPPDTAIAVRLGCCLITIAAQRGDSRPLESGWTLYPQTYNLHDWGSVYYEGVGWVPIDVSAGRQESDDPAVRNFYKSGLDCYRLVVNSDYSQPFTPRKIHCAASRSIFNVAR